MESIKVQGGVRLQGEVYISGAKNAVLPILAATLLATGQSEITNVPNLEDVRTIIEVLNSMGCQTTFKDHKVTVDASEVTSSCPPSELVRKMRASVLIMGPLLARKGYAKIALPGGCAIGTRPINLHLKGFAALGVEINTGRGYVEGKVIQKLKAATIYLDYPSVGATENIMMLAVFAKGVTHIENAAKEPEIVDLANMLNHMGAHVSGAGTDNIRIIGVESLHAARHQVIPDRIETGTFMGAAVMTGGDIILRNVLPDHIRPIIAKMREIGAVISEINEDIRICGPKQVLPTDIRTLPYPGFPTDMQAQMMAILTLAKGTSVVTETVFENRFMHVDELLKMGASISIEGNRAVVKGVSQLVGATVNATDLRAGAALILAGLGAEGVTNITGLAHIDRGYERVEEKFRNLGAIIKRVQVF